VELPGRPRDACLVFVGTLGYRRTRRLERLDSPRALVAWIADNGLVSAPIAAGAEDFDHAIVLRETIYRLATAKVEERRLTSTDVEILNGWAARPAVTCSLRSGHLVRQGTVTQVLAELARDAVELLGSSPSQRLRECDDPECTRLYVDRSRGHRRRWCDMEVCGNRVKAAEYRKRQGADPGSQAGRHQR
jgi:predicted RNA-binding Zn ribbon-like protein